MIYKKGQKVVCINATCNTYCRYPLKKGAIYTIHSHYQCACGSLQVALAEYTDVLYMRCGCSLTSHRRQTYYEWRFMPLDLFEEIMSMPENKPEEKEVQMNQSESSKK